MIGVGWALAVDDGAANAFVAITDIETLEVPDDGPLGMVENKPLDLAANTVTRQPTLFTPGPFTFTYEYTAARGKAQRARLAALRRVTKNWKVTSTDGTPWTITVPAVLSQQKFQPVTADGKVMVDVTVEITGASS